MPISLANLRSAYKTWGATLSIDGVPYTVVDRLPNRSMSFDQARSIYSVLVQEFPDVAAGTPALSTITLNGETELFFTGRVAERPIDDYPRSIEVSLVDELGKLDKALPETITWSNTSFPAAVREVLNAVGIADSEIESIYNPGSDFALGPVYAITIEKGTTARQVIDNLMDYGGTGIFVLASGKVQVRDFPGWPDSSPTIVYAYGANPAAGEFGFVSSKRTLGGFEGVIAQFTAKGPRRPDKKVPDATFTLSEVEGDPVTKTYDYLQTDAAAEAIAEREIVRRNRGDTIVQVTAPLNPLLRPGDSILFRNPVLGFTTNTPALVIGTATNDVTMTLTLSVGAQPAEGELSSIPPPLAAFELIYERQTATIAGITKVRTFVQAISAATDPSGFEITSRSWTATCTDGVTPTESSDLAPVFIFESLNGATITHSVESSSGEGAEHTEALTPGDQEIFTRSLSVAAATEGWKVLASVLGWRTYAGGTCTAVPNFNDKGPLIAGFSDGRLYQTQDFLDTEPILLYTFPSQVDCIFVNEGNPSRVLAGAGTALWQSGDAGATWLQLHDFAAPIHYVESSPANPDEIRVCAGNQLYISFDATSFTSLLTGATGSNCRKIASAPWGHAAVFSGTINTADVIQFEEGSTVDWSSIAEVDRPLELTSITALLSEPGYYVTSGAANDIVRDGLYPQLSYIANDGTTTKVYKLMQVGSNFVASYLTTTQDSGPHKLANNTMAFPIDDVASALRIGYGAPADPLRPPEVVLLPYGASGGIDMLYHWKPDQGFITRALPVPGAQWRGITINPLNQTEWIIWHWDGRLGTFSGASYTGAFYTRDAGVNWVEITTLGNSYGGNVAVLGAVFTGRGANWLLSEGSNFPFAAQTAAILYRGNGASLTSAFFHMPAAFSESEHLTDSLIAGAGDDVIGRRRLSDGNGTPQWRYFPAGSTEKVSTFVSSMVPQDLIDGQQRKLLAVQNTNIGYTADYRSAAPTPIISAGTSAVWCGDGVYVGGREGIGRIADLLSAPTLEIVAAASVSVGPVARGPKRIGVAAIGGGKLFGYNGEAWAAVDLPSGVPFCASVGVIEW